MHSLRYVIGDTVFFRTLKRLATDPAYTYDNTVTTNDVEELFSQAAGRNLKPFFDLYLRTTNRLEIKIRQTTDEKYRISLTNFDYPLPMEVTTGTGTTRMMIGKKEIEIESSTIPVVDKTGFYFKRVSYE
jgi:aminopeptidase N